MRVVLTGSKRLHRFAIVPEIIQVGHEVIGLARSDTSAQTLASSGAKVQRGNIIFQQHCSFVMRVGDS